MRIGALGARDMQAVMLVEFGEQRIREAATLLMDPATAVAALGYGQISALVAVHT